MSNLKKYIKTILNVHNIIYNELLFIFSSVKKQSYSIGGRISIVNKGEIEIGNNFKANSGVGRNPIGGDIILRLITTKNASIKIGNNVGISNSTIWSNSKVTIEDNVLIGGSCKIWDTDFHSLDYSIRGSKRDKGISKPIHIKKSAFIGGGSTILKGVTIGERSIIAAMSVVTKSIPKNEIWGGNPAKFIRINNFE